MTNEDNDNPKENWYSNNGNLIRHPSASL